MEDGQTILQKPEAVGENETLRRIKQAQEILESLGLPAQQCNEISAITFLALANIGRGDPWDSATARRLRIHDVLIFAQTKLRKKYAENTRETIRRQVIHQFEQARIVDRNPDDPSLPTNSPRTHYALTDEIIGLIHSFGTKSWSENVNNFRSRRTGLLELYAKKRKQQLIPVKLSSGKELSLSPGKHNELQVAVIEEFAPRFAPGAVVAYFGDTARKMLHLDRSVLDGLGLKVDKHKKLPDVVLYHTESERLFLVEAVTSHGPISPKRHLELSQMVAHIKASPIYVSAFPDLKGFKSHLADIAWDTEVWVAEIPDHLIHFNGDKFLR
ncbi:MAG: hypothetical protein JXN61_15650 [Sedimentisphaerales bacterium]|nr:hypothetical protein [Sedimentisphaerales bacterium]